MTGAARRPGRHDAQKVRERKQELRGDAIRRRRSIGREELAALSARVAENLSSLDEFRDAKLLVSYCAKDDEVQTRSIIDKALEEGKRVAVVVSHVPTKTLSFSEIESFEDDLAPGAFGILEPKPGHLRPVSLAEADLVLVPVVAWDESGGRLGYGAGYFDRALAGARGVKRIGLALESQRLLDVPKGVHDIPLDIIVTEKRIVRPRR